MLASTRPTIGGFESEYSVKVFPGTTSTVDVGAMRSASAIHMLTLLCGALTADASDSHTIATLSADVQELKDLVHGLQSLVFKQQALLQTAIPSPDEKGDSAPLKAHTSVDEIRRLQSSSSPTPSVSIIYDGTAVQMNKPLNVSTVYADSVIFSKVVACKVVLSTDYAVTATALAVPYDNVVLDTTGSYDVSTSIYTVPVSGLYKITFRHRADGEDGYVITELYINNAATSPKVRNICGEYDPDSAAVSFNLNLVDTATHLALLNAGDTVEIRIASYSATPAVYGSSTWDFSNFAIVMLAAT